MAGRRDRKNRSQTDVFLVGHSVILEACSSLPTNRDVLRDFFARRDESVSLGQIRNRYDIAKETHEAVVCFWRKANLPTLTDNAITRKVLWLWKKWYNLSKSRKKASVNEADKREKFNEFLSCLFEISPCDWRERIRATRNKDTACEDIIWFEKLQNGEKTGGLGGVDKAFAKRVCSLNKRENEKQSRIVKELNRKESEANAKRKLEFCNASDSDTENEICEQKSDELFRPTKDDNIVILKMPKDLSKKPVISSTADRLQISDSVLYQTLSAVAVVGGISGDQITISKSTVRRNRINNRSTCAEKIRQPTYNNSEDMLLTLHWDGKIMADGHQMVKDRLAILISGYPHYTEGKLVAVADVENSKGRTMADKIIKELRDADLLHKTYGAIVFDTTSSNEWIKIRKHCGIHVVCIYHIYVDLYCTLNTNDKTMLMFVLDYKISFELKLIKSCCTELFCFPTSMN